MVPIAKFLSLLFMSLQSSSYQICQMLSYFSCTWNLHCSSIALLWCTGDVKVPEIRRPEFKSSLSHLVSVGIWKLISLSEWIFTKTNKQQQKKHHTGNKYCYLKVVLIIQVNIKYKKSSINPFMLNKLKDLLVITKSGNRICAPLIALYLAPGRHSA